MQTVQGITVEFIFDPELGIYTARVPHIPAYGEGETKEEAVADLKEAIAGYIETFGLEDAMQRVSTPISIQHINVDLAEFAGSQ